MTINSGAVLAHYKIVSLLGRGGMGEVYKAMDSRLSRLVALKILPHSVVEDENRVRRFIQEAKAASALNHPHILTIHEIGEAQLQQQSIGDSAVDSDGLAPTATAGILNYIAMELIEGETLRERIRRDRTDLKSLLRLLIQVAEGLAKAHGAGIVHRDLKPDNIMISADGYAKILDFGLAKLIEPEKAQTSGEPSDDTTVMIGPQSRSGIILGTVGYMSPEQAQGKPVDQRSDIFSFGCILYQAATGHMPFEADSLIDSLHKVIHSAAPPITDLNPGAPLDLQRIIRRCLAKDMEERCQMIKDVAIELKELLRDLESQHGLEHSAPPSLRAGAFSAPTHDSVEHDTVAVNLETSTSKPALSAANMARNKITWIAAVVATLVLGIGALLVGAFIAYSHIWRVPSEPKMAISAPVMKMARLTSGGKASQAAISPDGRYVVLVSIEDGKQSLRVRQVNTTSDVQIVPAGDVRYTGLTFSPDGDFIYFVVSEKNGPVASLYYVPVLGGTARRLVTDVDSAVTFSPDGKRLAFVRTAADQGEQQLIIVNADGSGEQKVATRKMPNFFTSLSWAPDGKSFACAVGSFVPNYNSYVVEIPTEGGNEKPIGSHNWLSIGQLAWLQDRGGLIVNASEQDSGNFESFQIWYLPPNEGEARRITNDLNNYAGVSLTADSRRLVTVQSDTITNLWLVPANETTRSKQVTFGAGKRDGWHGVAWTPDGRIVYVSNASGNDDYPDNSGHGNGDDKCIFDGKDKKGKKGQANSQNVKVRTISGVIDLKGSLSSGAFGNNPVNGTSIIVPIAYSLSDNSKKATQQINVQLIYYAKRSQIPAALVNTVTENRSAFFQNTPILKSPRPPIIIVSAFN